MLSSNNCILNKPVLYGEKNGCVYFECIMKYFLGGLAAPLGTVC